MLFKRVKICQEYIGSLDKKINVKMPAKDLSKQRNVKFSIIEEKNIDNFKRSMLDSKKVSIISTPSATNGFLKNFEGDQNIYDSIFDD